MMTRRCLGPCGKEFKQTWNGQRVCNACQRANSKVRMPPMSGMTLPRGLGSRGVSGSGNGGEH